MDLSLSLSLPSYGPEGTHTGPITFILKALLYLDDIFVAGGQNGLSSCDVERYGKGMGESD